MPKRLDLLVVINQEITPASVLLEEHYPLLGVGRVCDHMGVEGHAFGMFGLHSFTIHVGHHATRALKILYLQCMPAQLHLSFHYKHLQPLEAVDLWHLNYHCMLILCTCIH